MASSTKDLDDDGFEVAETEQQLVSDKNEKAEARARCCCNPVNLWRRIKQMYAEEKELELMIEKTLGKQEYEKSLVAKANVIRDIWVNFCIFSTALTIV